ncbi:MAG: hypothetical protein JOZ03_07830, partial [Gammaproteobacteria bacterium]|nr:hypothetical protein [Gammaproteobacteria bacterium]
FSNRLERSLVPRWEAVALGLYSGPPAGPAAASVREALRACALKWQWALRLYATGLRVHDASVVMIAFEHLKQAGDARQQAGQLLQSYRRAP